MFVDTKTHIETIFQVAYSGYLEVRDNSGDNSDYMKLPR